MASYDVPDPEDYMECPYDNTHMVMAKRFPYHLMKCRRNYSGADYAVCPFNAMHEMPRPELRYHVANCKDRVMLQQDLVYKQMQARGEDYGHHGQVQNPSSDWEQPPCKEDWDADIKPVGFLDPKIWKEKRMIGKTLIGMTPAEKKRFHEKLRRNYFKKQAGLPLSDDDDDDLVIRKEPAEPSNLRKPTNVPLVLQQAPQKKQVPKQPMAYQYSLSMAGRGRGVVSLKQAPPPGGLTNGHGDDMKPSSRIAANIFHTGGSTQAGSPHTTAAFGRPKPHMGKPGGNIELEKQLAYLREVSKGRGVGRGQPISEVPPLPGGLQEAPHFMVPKVTAKIEVEDGVPVVLQNGRVDDSSSETPVHLSGSGEPLGEVHQFEAGTMFEGEMVNGHDAPHAVMGNVEGVSLVADDSDMGVERAAPVSEDGGQREPQVVEESRKGAPPVEQGERELSPAELAKNKEKEMKKLQKKLKGIEQLEEKQAAGTELNTEEEEKVSKKEEILKQLEKLRLE